MDNKSFIENSLIFISIFLVGLGLIMIYSSSSIFAAEKFSDTGFFFKKQFLFGCIGIGLMFLLQRIPYDFLMKIAYPLFFISIALLVLLMIPGIGTKVGGAVRWLRVGPVSFQPSEIAKLGVVLIMAYSLSRKDPEKLKKFSIGILPHLIYVVPVSVLILLQPDFGNAMILLLLLFIILFASAVPLRYLFLLAGSAVFAGVLLVYSKGYRLERLFAFLDPWENHQDSGFQIVQSFLAFGAGGLWGTGLGNGTQKLFYLPAPHTDFILAVIGEELGFVAVAIVIILFSILLWCGIKIALHASDKFGAYLALGIISLISVQAALNMGVVMGMLPTKGLPLPFLSYGGSSLVINLVCIGILLNISKNCHFMVAK